MNRINCILLGITVAIFLGSVSSIYAQSVSGALSITNLQISPNPLYAGSKAVISFQIYDSYSSTLNNVNIQLSGSYPLLNFSPTQSTLINSMSQGIYGGSNTYFTYDINIPKNIPSGTYTMDVLATYQTTTTASGSTQTITGSSTIPITIYIYGMPELNVNGYLPSGTTIQPGQTSNIQLTVTNSGTGEAYNASIQVLNNKYFTVSGPDEFSLGNIQAGSSQTVNADLFTLSNITKGLSNLSTVITYQNQNGSMSKIYRNLSMSILVNNPEIKLSIIKTNPSILYSGGNQTLELLVQNIGSGDAQNLQLNFLNGNNIFVTNSNTKVFVGTLGSESSTTEMITIQAGPNTQNNESIPVHISYQNANLGPTMNSTEYIPLSIAKSVVFNIKNINDNLTPGATYAPLNLTITNIGNEPANNVSLSLQTIYPISPVSGDAYLNYLGINQSVNVTFYVSIDPNGKQGNYPIVIYEQWKQPNSGINQQFFGSTDYYAEVFSNSGSGKSTNNTEQQSSSGGNGSAIVLIVLVIIVVIAIIYYKMKVSKNKGSKK
jgi:hypothetical protein